MLIVFALVVKCSIINRNFVIARRNDEAIARVPAFLLAIAALRSQ